MRSRSRTTDDTHDLSPLTRVLTNGTCANPTLSTTSTVDYGRFSGTSKVESMEDVVVPLYGILSKRGQIFNNPLYQTVVTTTDVACSYYHNMQCRGWNTGCTPNKYLYWGQRDSGMISLSHKTADDMLAAPYVSMDSVKDAAVTEAWSRVELTEAETLVMLAEGKKTILSMVYIFKRLLKILRAAKRLRLQTLRRELSAKEIANRWMELRYSLRPLVYDVSGVLDAIATKPKNNRMTFRGTEESSASTSDTSVVNYSQTWQEFTRESTRTIHCRAGVLASMEAATKFNIWGGDQLLEGAWELVPFSFVVDWFFNIGKFIASWTPEAGVHPLASWVVTQETTVQSITATDCGFRNPTTWCPPTSEKLAEEYANVGSGKTITTMVKHRIPSPWRPWLPSFRVNLDAAKLIDLLILGRNLFR